MPEAHGPAELRTGRLHIPLRPGLGALLLFLAFAAFARVYLVSSAPQQPRLWLLGSAICACASWWLLRARTTAATRSRL